MVLYGLKDNIKWPSNISICEVGPRDGLQNEKTLLSVDQKVRLIEDAVDAGAKIIEVGSFVNPKAIPPMADTEEVVRRMSRVDGVEYRVLVLNLKGLQRAESSGIQKAKLGVSASLAHSMSNLNKTPEEAVRGFEECAKYAANYGMILSGAISTAFGCPFEGKVSLDQVISVVQCFQEIGVMELSLSDTTGMANPQQVYEYSLRVKEQFPDITWNLHFHNTRGMGLANVVAGMMAGIQRYDSSFAGLGGCPFAPGATGNIATEDLIHMCHEMNIETGYDLDKMIAIGKNVQQIVGHDTASFVLKAGKCSDIIQS